MSSSSDAMPSSSDAIALQVDAGSRHRVRFVGAVPPAPSLIHFYEGAPPTISVCWGIWAGRSEDGKREVATVHGTRPDFWGGLAASPDVTFEVVWVQERLVRPFALSAPSTEGQNALVRALLPHLANVALPEKFDHSVVVELRATKLPFAGFYHSRSGFTEAKPPLSYTAFEVQVASLDEYSKQKRRKKTAAHIMRTQARDTERLTAVPHALQAEYRGVFVVVDVPGHCRGPTAMCVFNVDMAVADFGARLATERERRAGDMDRLAAKLERDAALDPELAHLRDDSAVSYTAAEADMV